MGNGRKMIQDEFASSTSEKYEEEVNKQQEQKRTQTREKKSQAET